MNNNQQLFEINKRINQIKRNLQSRQEKAQQWSLPYEKILKNNKALAANNQIFSKTYGNNFRNSHNQNIPSQKQQMTSTFSTKTQRKQFYENKAKHSRKKIKQYHNELKQLQELLQKKTKLHIKRQEGSQKVKIAYDLLNLQKKSSSLSTKVKNKNETFSNSMILMGILGKTTSKNQTKINKQRINPFVGFKVEKIIQLYQQVKNSGQQNRLNQTLGVGIQFTPYSILKKELKKEDFSLNQQRFMKDLTQIYKTDEKQNLKSQQFFKCNRNLPKVLQLKINEQKDIYINSPGKNEKSFIRMSPQKNEGGSIKRKSMNIFQTRMKRLLQESTNFQQCGTNYLITIKRSKNKTAYGMEKNSFAKIKANHPYKKVFGLE